MAQQPKLDEKYESGVWYDEHAGEFCEIRDMGDTIGLVEPEYSEPYFIFDEDGFSKEEAIDFIHRDMHKVSSEVINYPKRIVKSALQRQTRNDIDELLSISRQDVIDLMYARDSVVIKEIDN